MVAKFVELWPPLQKRWVPRTESRARAELCGGQVILSGRVDLALGQPRGAEAGTLLVDFKTGRTVMAHLEDLRFYALLETLRCGVPPFRVASYELDAGTFSSEDVTEATLDAAVRRTIRPPHLAATSTSGAARSTCASIGPAHLRPRLRATGSGPSGRASRRSPPTAAPCWWPTTPPPSPPTPR
jgi:hypothetical protein